MLVVSLSLFNLTACFGTPVQPTIDYGALISTAVAQTEIAKALVSMATSSPTPTTSANMQPTATLRPNITPFPTFTSFPTSYSVYLPTSVPCYAMIWIKDVTVPDNTSMSLGQSFTKTWRLKNTGTCTWTTSYRLKFVSGNQMGASTYTNLPQNVAPGGLVDVSVPMVAPSTPGTYQGNYKMVAADGTAFYAGIGVPIWVKIVVSGPHFAVINVSNFTVANYNSNLCTDPGGHTVIFTAVITTNGAGRVDTHWVFANGATQSIGPSDHLDFPYASNQTVTATWSFTSSIADGKAYIYIDEPNHQLFGPGGSFTYTCP